MAKTDERFLRSDVSHRPLFVRAPYCPDVCPDYTEKTLAGNYFTEPESFHDDGLQTFGAFVSDINKCFLFWDQRSNSTVNNLIIFGKEKCVAENVMCSFDGNILSLVFTSNTIQAEAKLLMFAHMLTSCMSNPFCVGNSFLRFLVQPAEHDKEGNVIFSTFITF